MICPNCNQEINKENASFCPHCGSPLTDLDKTTQALHSLKAVSEEPKIQEIVPNDEITIPETRDIELTTQPELDPYSDKADLHTDPDKTQFLDEDAIPTDAPKKEKDAKFIYYSKESDLIIPSKYRPLTSLGFFGYTILFAIPVIGWICALVFSFNNHNISRRNLARSFLLWALICILIIALLFYLRAPIINSFLNLFGYEFK